VRPEVRNLGLVCQGHTAGEDRLPGPLELTSEGEQPTVTELLLEPVQDGLGLAVQRDCPPLAALARHDNDRSLHVRAGQGQ